MGFDYIMGVGRTPQITQDVNINAYSAYVDDLCQGGTISLTLSGTWGTPVGDLNNLINPNYTDTALPYVLDTTSSITGTASIVIDLKRRVGLGKHNMNISFTHTASTNPTISAVFSVSDDNITYTPVYSNSATAASGTVTFSVNKDTFYFGKFGRYIKIFITKSGVTSTSGSVNFSNRIIIFPDYTQF